jgi:hypothetical protein
MNNMIFKRKKKFKLYYIRIKYYNNECKKIHINNNSIISFIII